MDMQGMKLLFKNAKKKKKSREGIAHRLDARLSTLTVHHNAAHYIA